MMSLKCRQCLFLIPAVEKYPVMVIVEFFDNCGQLCRVDGFKFLRADNVPQPRILAIHGIVHQASP